MIDASVNVHFEDLNLIRWEKVNPTRKEAIPFSIWKKSLICVNIYVKSLILAFILEVFGFIMLEVHRNIINGFDSFLLLLIGKSN